MLDKLPIGGQAPGGCREFKNGAGRRPALQCTDGLHLDLLIGTCLACLEFSCLSRVIFSDLDQPPGREKERRDERVIRKEGNSTHQKRNQPYPRRRKEGKRKERQGKEKGKKEIRKGRDRSEHYHHPRGRTKEEDKGKRK